MPFENERSSLFCWQAIFWTYYFSISFFLPASMLLWTSHAQFFEYSPFQPLSISFGLFCKLCDDQSAHHSNAYQCTLLIWQLLLFVNILLALRLLCFILSVYLFAQIRCFDFIIFNFTICSLLYQQLICFKQKTYEYLFRLLTACNILYDWRVVFS